MALVSSVPKLTFTPAGLVVPSESDVLAGVQADINAAFGGGLNPSLETPQGQLASSQTAVIGDKNNEVAYMVNQVDPMYADGRFQDAIARIYFLNRKGATATTVQATVMGLAGTVIPAGTLAEDTSGNTYFCTGAVTIGATGTAVAEFQNQKTGPIPCPSGTLTQVYQAVPGWDAITNDDDGALGSEVESRVDFEYRRKNSVAINANGTPGAIYAEVFDLPNVLDCYVLDNGKGEVVEKGATNYPVLPHSIYVAVVGGIDKDIAKAIWRKKDGGCDTNGNTSVVITDESGYSHPQPIYTINFHRPPNLAVKFAVNIANDPSLPSNIVDLVKDAVIKRFNGADGTSRERIGATIYASRYYGTVAEVASNVAVISILIGTADATLTKLDVGIDQRPVISAEDIAVNLL